MKIALLSSSVPHVDGGYRQILDWLAPELEAHGHLVERIYLPFDATPSKILKNLTLFRALDLSQSADQLITFRPPSHLSEHPRKVVWFIHHLREYYDLWGTHYQSALNTASSRAVREAIISADNKALGSAHRVFSNSATVSARLKAFNDIVAPVLYPPVRHPERFRCEDYGDEILSICRIEHHKRPHLLIEAMKYVKTPVRLRLCGLAASAAYLAEIQRLISDLPAGRITLEHRWITEDEKHDRLATALAVAYVPFAEDSYGYPVLEAAHAAKAAIVTTDGGGVGEFVLNGENGVITTPDAKSIAAVFDTLWSDRQLARRLGDGARDRIAALDISWSRVVEALTA